MHITTWGHILISTVISDTAQCVHVTSYVALIIQDSWACGTSRRAPSCPYSPWTLTYAAWCHFMDARLAFCSASATALPSSASGPHSGLSARKLQPPQTETCLESPAAVRKRRARDGQTDIREHGLCYMTEEKQNDMTWGFRRKTDSLE